MLHGNRTTTLWRRGALASAWLLALSAAASAEPWVVRSVGIEPEPAFVATFGLNADVMVDPLGRIVVAGGLGPLPREPHLATMLPGETFFDHRPVGVVTPTISAVLDTSGLVNFAMPGPGGTVYFGQDMGAWGGLSVGTAVTSPAGPVLRPTVALNAQSIPTVAWYDPAATSYYAASFDTAAGQWGGVQTMATSYSSGGLPRPSPAVAFDSQGRRISAVFIPLSSNVGVVQVFRQTDLGQVQIHEVETVGRPVAGVSLAIGSDDEIAFAYVQGNSVIVRQITETGVTEQVVYDGPLPQLLPRSLTYDAQGRLALAIAHAGVTDHDVHLARVDAEGQWQVEALPVKAIGATVAFDASNAAYVAAIESSRLSLVSQNIAPLVQGQFNIDPEDPYEAEERFTQAIKNPAAFLADHPGMSEADLAAIADINGDGAVDDQDAYAFADAFAASDGASVQGGPSLAEASDPSPLMDDISTRSDAYLAFDLANTDPDLGDGDENFFGTNLATGKPYEAGDSRGDLTGTITAGVADQAIDADDIDYLYEQINAGESPDMRADLDDDGVLDQGDVDLLVHDILGTYYGDASLTGSVSLLDLDILGRNFTATGGWAAGDFNGDGVVSLADLDILGQNFNAGVNSSAVPEPATSGLLTIGCLCLLARRRTSRRSETQPRSQRLTNNQHHGHRCLERKNPSCSTVSS
ncbi:MAG: PEP-CTERM sorting domain-containing protein [Phycisphaeraceae bacterium]